MRTTNLNGHILSEKEMREVKGGHEFISPGGANLCPQCGSWALEEIEGKKDHFRCLACSSVIEIKK